jgi:hypothetical protein
VWLVFFFAAAILAALFAPLEQTLGSNVRLVVFHGAWVWVALLLFLGAAVVGAVGLLTRRTTWHAWSRASGQAGLLFWLTFLPMSLVVMQANWNGLFLDEPRFRTPLNLAIVGLLLQVGLLFLPQWWTSVANLLFGAVLLFTMQGADSVLHPESPIFSAEAGGIRLYFFGVLLLLSLAGWQVARLLKKRN